MPSDPDIPKIKVIKTKGAMARTRLLSTINNAIVACELIVSQRMMIIPNLNVDEVIAMITPRVRKINT
jgi:hypothetical protein